MNYEAKKEQNQDQNTVEIEQAELEAVATGLPVRSKVKAGPMHACKSSTLV